MRESTKRRIKELGMNIAEFAPKPKAPNIVQITREEFDLLDVQDENAIYYIIENDGSVTARKGE